MKIRELTEGVGRIVKGVNTTPDVGVDAVTKQAAKFGNKVDKDGRPPTLSKKVKGKSTNVLFNLGLAESYKLQLERDKEVLVLHIKDTKTGKRTEVRGKPGYESGNYDPNDSLHVLLDTVGKSANISELMNGEVVTINPKHPDAEKAKAATDKAYNENLEEITRRNVLKGLGLAGAAAATGAKVDIAKAAQKAGGATAREKIQAMKPGEQFWYVKVVDPIKPTDRQEYVFSLDTFKNIDDARKTVRKVFLDYGYETDIRIEVTLARKKPVKENFADGKKKVNEVLDNPAPYTWRKDEFGFPTAEAKELGLHIAFDGRNQPQWEVSFYREQEDGSVVMNRPTGQGKEFEVFATVNAAIKDFMKMQDDVEGLTLDARKDGGVDGQGRVSLYRRMMNNYAKKLGWEFEEWDQGQMVMMGIYKPRTNENFADGKKKGKSRPGRVKRSGASCNGSVTDLRKRAKNASGEKAKMYHWCANMKSGRKKK